MKTITSRSGCFSWYWSRMWIRKVSLTSAGTRVYLWSKVSTVATSVLKDKEDSLNDGQATIQLHSPIFKLNYFLILSNSSKLGKMSFFYLKIQPFAITEVQNLNWNNCISINMSKLTPLRWNGFTPSKVIWNRYKATYPVIWLRIEATTTMLKLFPP